jgi:hypothetical protein
MASNRGWRFFTFGVTAALCTMILSASASAYFDPSGSTIARPYDNMIVISIADYQLPAFDILLPLVREDRVASSFPAFRPLAVKERASRSAVRATVLSGWRSGRVRTLAG